MLLPDMVRAGYLVVRMGPGNNERRVIGLQNTTGWKFIWNNRCNIGPK